MSAVAPVTAGTMAAAPGRVRRMTEVALFVGAWMALGLLLHLDSPRYQLLGVPFALAFQLLVRRRPLRQLWVRDGPPFRLDARGAAIAAVLLALGYPAYQALNSVPVARWVVALWLVAYAVGALAAAYALRHLHADGRDRAFAASAVAIGLLWIALSAGPELANAARPLPLAAMVAAGLRWATLYFPIAFVLEEVQFRGLVDAHVHRPGEARGWLSALVVSALWSIWHLPLALDGTPLADVVASLLLVHVTIGVPLSFAWRRSGNLVLPAAAHALIDAVRDGLATAL
ncbi:MAG TPA: CPBP family intramembrane glutamic endopeptidase [Thermomicrobiales bacterium]|nr:CPBP family intramembrane glutamic endopeptidase [Thermomicrobiales bacterium]